MNRRDTLTFAAAAALACGVLGGCTYTVPLTEHPTRAIDERLIGDWVSVDGKEKIHVRMLDDSTYVGTDDGSLFRAYHSEVAGAAFITAQDLDSFNRKYAIRKYAYISYAFTAKDDSLALRAVSDAVIPAAITTSGEAQKLLRENLHDPKLFGEDPSWFVRGK